ncbi:MAG: fabG5 [Clostridia bacterium]|jgi:short-subunit dehydrogenase|nr:fabG5 [Clostridia bacterium]
MNTFNANLFASVRLDRGFLLAMVKQQKGVIVHISSIQRKLPGNMTITYSAAKATLTNYGINKSCVGFPYLFFPDFVATY